MIGELLDNRYEITEFVGKGGMALVYLARDHRTGHDVAVKILKPEYNGDNEFVDRFNREAVAASKMSHHNIVNLLDVGNSGNCHYIVMEYVNGKTLKEVIDEKAPLAEEVAVQITVRILSALQHAHKNNIIHRDIKPQNILVHSEGHIKVADFGIARLVGRNTVNDQKSVMGSVLYISPEQASGHDVTFASDIYSAGVVLFEMLTGKVPFDGDSTVTVAMQHINAEVPSVRAINKNVSLKTEQIIYKAMSKRPEDRYQSAYEMAKALQDAVDQPAISEYDDSDTAVHGFLLGHNKSEKKNSRLLSHAGSTAATQNAKYKQTIIMFSIIALSVAVIAVSVPLIIDLIVNTRTVPNILGRTEEDARYQIEKVDGLVYKVQGMKASEDYPAGTVCETVPAWGTSKRKGETVFVWVSTGSEYKQMPDLYGKTVEEAIYEAERAGLTITVSAEKQRSTKEYGTVISQSPIAGNLVKTGETAEIYLSGGSVEIPNLIGSATEEAISLLEEIGFCGELCIKEVPGSKAETIGTVFEQSFTCYEKQLLPGERSVLDVNIDLYVYVDDYSNQERRE